MRAFFMDRTKINARLIQVAAGKRTHPHYERTVERAAYYRALSTGKGIEVYMRPFYLRTDEELFATLCRVTRQITPSVCSNFRDLLETAYRSFYRREVSYGEEEANERRTIEFEAMLKAFSGGKGVDVYLQERLLEYQSIDPNAWIIEQWKPFDPVLQYAQVYPFEASAEMALDFAYDVGELAYLTVRTWIDNPLEKGKQLQNLICFQKGMSVTLTQTGKQTVGLDLIDAKGDVIFTPGSAYNIAGSMWVYMEYFDGLDEIKAKRVGYRRDLQTNGETYVWPWEAAEPSLDQSLKIVSELQLTAAHVAFPITVRVGDPCNDETDGGCGGSGTLNGHTCKMCRGTGKKKWSTSTMEEIVVDMPMDAKDLPDLSKILYYVSPDVSILAWQQQYKTQLIAQARRDFIGNDTYDQNDVQQVARTATENILTQQNKNNPVYKYFTHYAAFWEFTVYAIADITGKRMGLEAQIFVGKDLKLKTIGELMIELGAAVSSGAGAAVIRSIQWDMMRIVTLDNPEDFIEYQIQDRFDPFAGCTPEEKALKASDTLVPLPKRVLYANLGWIFDEIEMDNPGFYKMPHDAQRIIVDAKVQSIIEANNAQRVVTSPQITLPVVANNATSQPATVQTAEA